MASKTTKMTKGHSALTGNVVLAIAVVCIIAGPFLFYVNLFFTSLLWGCVALATLIIVWAVQQSKARKEIFPLQAVPVKEPVCIGCSRSDNLALVNYQFHYVELENLPEAFELFDGVINEFKHANSGFISICNRCVVRRSKRETLFIGLSLSGFVALSYLPIIATLPVIDTLLRGTIVYVLVITASYYLKTILPWRSWSEEVGLEIAEKETKADHPRWAARGDNWYRRHLDETTIEPVFDDDDIVLPIAMNLVAAHVLAALIWAGLSMFGIEPWFHEF